MWSTTADSVDLWVQEMVAAGWVDATATTWGPHVAWGPACWVDTGTQGHVYVGWVDTTATTTKICSSCRDDKTRQGFARRQWRSSIPECKSCTFHRAEEDRHASTRRIKVATDDFVPPAPRPKPTTEKTQKQGTDSRRRPSSLKSGLSSGIHGRHGLPNSGYVKKDEELKSCRVIPGAELQVHAGAGIAIKGWDVYAQKMC